MIRIGERYGLLTIIDTCKKNNRTVYKCKCDCGNLKEVTFGYKLYKGNIKSCGCLRSAKCADRNRKNRQYSADDTRLVDIWRHMHYRCEKKNDSGYKYYGAKGIKVCEEWKDFNSFAAWSHQNGYSDNLTIDRIDYTGCYEPNNCRWVSFKVQNNNSSHCHYLTYDGTTASISEWSDITGLPYNTIKTRINKLCWTTKEALTVPYCQRKSKYVNKVS